MIQFCIDTDLRSAIVSYSDKVTCSDKALFADTAIEFNTASRSDTVVYSKADFQP